ncbi:MAG TPA: S8 family serine peptidase, partial [Saprospiraceae bacterium]|nr:S8 family serine peptidase [Saprospiraceae bacterium]
MRKWIVSSLILFAVHLSGQEIELPLLVKLRQNVDISRFQNELGFPAARTISTIKCISQESSVYSIKVADESKLSLLEHLQRLQDVIWAVEDVPLEFRAIPDDSYINQQWHLDKISAFSSWDISTGGLTPSGDTIVIAVIDDGFMPNHEDLKANVWKNYAEISGDGKDNDNNGYVDDFAGLNVATGADNHPLRSHGTATSGLVGASGNNGKGVSGINWNVKLLLISEANSASNVIVAYEYVLALRKLYNETNGAKGAFVVATNLSAGIDDAFPDDNPIFQEWCTLYDKLGEAGVININAVPNRHVDIDIVGDMPSTCSSPFLIKVTMTQKDDLKDEQGGYGKVHVNLAAPGSEIYSTTTNHQYNSFTGTSNAAPQVAGTVGLLYGAPCENFARLYKNEPAAAATAIRSMILEGVDKIAGLGAYTSSGGRLNVLGAITRLRDFCEGSSGDLSIQNIFPNPASQRLSIEYESDNYELHHFAILNALGQNLIAYDFNPPFFGEKKLELDLSKYGFPTGIYFVS